MPLYDACIDAGIRIVHVRHEAAAVFMADAWAQVTGQVGVAMLTAAPGISNGIAPLYSAAQSESPVLLLSGDSPLSEDGWGSFQEMDQAAMSAPLTKHSARITQAAELSFAIDRALDLALAPRPGPVHLALPFDLLSQESGMAELPPRPAAPAAALPTAAEVQALAQLLHGAQRPVVLTGPAQGRGALRAQWQQWTQQLALPVVNMGSPRGLRDPSIGAVAGCIAQADVVLLAGKPLDYTLRFGQVPALGEQARVVVVEPDARLRERAARLLGPRLALNLAAAPEHLMPLLASAADAAHAAGRAAWQAQVAQAVASRQLAAPNATTPARPNALLSPQALCEAVQRVLQAAEEPILVCDGGEFGQWAQAYCTAPVRLINGMSGAIGGGICYAIAAKLARPQATVVLMMGDGTAGFHLPEFDTAAREGAGILAVIGNDLAWNAELVIQKNTYGSDRLIGCSLSASARYHEAAAALGGVGYAADNAEQLASALAAALASGQPACVNVAIDGRPAPLFSAQAAATH
jgi:acetolactate synthase-1/2/3 large subunit